MRTWVHLVAALMFAVAAGVLLNEGRWGLGVPFVVVAVLLCDCARMEERMADDREELERKTKEVTP